MSVLETAPVALGVLSSGRAEVFTCFRAWLLQMRGEIEGSDAIILNLELQAGQSQGSIADGRQLSV